MAGDCNEWVGKGQEVPRWCVGTTLENPYDVLYDVATDVVLDE